MSIAFCFLLYDTVKHPDVWEEFFQDVPTTKHTIYAHIKKISPSTLHWLRKNKIKPVKTDYCDVSLVFAWIQLLKNALKNPKNKYFCILSGECIPLFPFQKVYRKITASKKSRLNVDNSAESYFHTGLYWADQWTILNRKHAKLLVKLTTKSGKKFVDSILPQIEDYCPDEILPINWFVKHYGKPSSSTFKKEIKIAQTTYTYWDGKHTSPVKFTYPRMIKIKKKICSCGAVFGRKFNSKATRELALKC